MVRPMPSGLVLKKEASTRPTDMPALEGNVLKNKLILEPSLSLHTAIVECTKLTLDRCYCDI
jgi:hypothetical protein